MPDSNENAVVVQITATLTLTPARFAALLLRDEAAGHPEIVAALAQVEAAEPIPAQPPPAPVPGPAEPPAPTPANDPPAPPQPAAARSGRPPRANGKAAPVKAESAEPEPETPPPPLEEPEVRAVLRLYSTTMPGRDTAVVKLLQEIGGAPRLADCPRETWASIVATAKQGIAENAQAAD